MDIYGGGGSPSTSPPPDCFLDSSSNSQHLPPPAPDPDPDHDFFSHFPSLHTDEAAELEWLSQFVDDTTSFHDFPPNNHTLLNLQPSSHTTTTKTSFPDDIPNSNNENKKPSPSSSHYSHAPSTSSSSSTSGSVMKSRSKREFHGSGGGGGGRMVRRCSHCASEKTPQWRTGPLGPKTLCNACGVRFKSGRLVPEYRPAASPTFVLTQHSNSHRKVMELRRQKELLRQQQQQQQHDFKVC